MNKGTRTVLLSGVAAFALLQPLYAFAQQAGEPVRLQEVVVEGQSVTVDSDDAAVGPVNGVVAKETETGMKVPAKITEIPQSVSVIGRTEIEDQGAQKVDEALRYTAGVFTQPFGPDSDTNWMFIRGFQATANGTYMDGLQLFSYAFGGFYVDSFGLERIEVLKGPASVLYGGSNPGGIVNYVSKRPEFEGERYVETGINDAGNAYLGFDVQDTANQDSVAYRINGRVAGGDTYTEYQDGWRGFISPSITWKPNEETKLTILANYSHIDEKHGGGTFLPYYGTVKDRVVGGVNYGKIDPDANFSEPDVDSYEREQGSIGYEFEHVLDNDWIVRSNARYGAASIDEVQVYPNGWAQETYANPALPPTDLARINFGHDTNIATFLLDNQVEGKFDTGRIEHTLLAGIDFKYYKIDQVQPAALFGATPDIDAFDPEYGAPLTPREPYLNQELWQRQIGIYAQDQLRFADGWLLTLNGRYDWVKTDADNRPNFYNPDPADFDATQGQASGRVGLAYEFDNGLTPYISVATFFNPVIETNAVTGELFKPEEGVQYEAGIKYVPTFVDGLFTLSVFDLTRRNVLTAAAPTPAVPFPSNVQTGEVRSRGIELEGKVNITEDFRVTGALTAYNLKVTKDEDSSIIGMQPFLVPEVMASASVDYTFRGDGWYDGISVGGGIRYYGKSWADELNTLEVPAVTLADAKIGYAKENWGVDLNVTNLFDKEYVSGCQGINVCSYGERRSLKFKAHFTW